MLKIIKKAGKYLEQRISTLWAPKIAEEEGLDQNNLEAPITEMSSRRDPLEEKAQPTLSKQESYNKSTLSTQKALDESSEEQTIPILPIAQETTEKDSGNESESAMLRENALLELIESQTVPTPSTLDMGIGTENTDETLETSEILCNLSEEEQKDLQILFVLQKDHDQMKQQLAHHKSDAQHQQEEIEKLQAGKTENSNIWAPEKRMLGPTQETRLRAQLSTTNGQTYKEDIDFHYNTMKKSQELAEALGNEMESLKKKKLDIIDALQPQRKALYFALNASAQSEYEQYLRLKSSRTEPDSRINTYYLEEGRQITMHQPGAEGAGANSPNNQLSSHESSIKESTHKHRLVTNGDAIPPIIEASALTSLASIGTSLVSMMITLCVIKGHISISTPVLQNITLPILVGINATYGTVFVLAILVHISLKCTLRRMVVVVRPGPQDEDFMESISKTLKVICKNGQEGEHNVRALAKQFLLQCANQRSGSSTDIGHNDMERFYEAIENTEVTHFIPEAGHGISIGLEGKWSDRRAIMTVFDALKNVSSMHYATFSMPPVKHGTNNIKARNSSFISQLPPYRPDWACNPIIPQPTQDAISKGHQASEYNFVESTNKERNYHNNSWHSKLKKVALAVLTRITARCEITDYQFMECLSRELTAIAQWSSKKLDELPQTSLSTRAKDDRPLPLNEGAQTLLNGSIIESLASNKRTQ